MISIKLQDRFFNDQEIEKPAKKEMVKSPKNHIWLADNSGSMYSYIRELIRVLTKRVSLLPVGDRVTLGWFSGSRDYKFFIKDFKITENLKDENSSEFKHLKQQIEKEMTDRGSTCFTDILVASKEIMKESSVFSKDFLITFLSDGYHNSGPFSGVLKACEELKKTKEINILSSMVVAFGNCADDENLLEMAKIWEGGFTRSSNMNQFSISLEEFINTGSATEGKIAVDLPKDAEDAFQVNGKNITLLKIEDNKVYASFQEDEKTLHVYFTTKKPAGKEIVLSKEGILGKHEEARTAKGLYAYSLIQSQKLKYGNAMDIAGRILGDKKLVDIISKSYAPEELANAEEIILNAVAGPKGRLTEGFDIACVPNKNAICLLDFLYDAQSDKEASFLPYDKRFVYNRISKKTLLNEEVKPVRREREGVVFAPLNAIVWNDSKMNISIRATYPVNVIVEDKELKTKAKKLGLSNEQPAIEHRNFTLVEDGNPNVENLVVTLSNELAEKYKDFLTKLEVIESRQTYLLNIKKFPVINRAMVEGRTSATELFKKAWEEIKVEGILKAFKYYLKEVDEIAKDDKTLFLEEIGIKNGAFSSDTEVDKSDLTKLTNLLKDEFQVELIEDETAQESFYKTLKKVAKDSLEEIVENGLDSVPLLEKAFLGKPYNLKKDQIASVIEILKTFNLSNREVVKEFQIKISGCSSLPSVDKVNDKVAKKGKLTVAEELVYAGIKLFEDAKLVGEKVQQAWLETNIKAKKLELNKIRKYIHETKFAVLLARESWFDEFKTKDEKTLSLKLEGKELEFTIEVRKVRVER